MNGSAVLLALGLLAQPPAPEAAPSLRPAKAVADAYATLRAAGLLDNREATLEEVREKLAEGQDRYVRGDALGSAVALLELVHGPRFSHLADVPEMSSARYHLGVSLHALGAEPSAAAAYRGVIARGSGDPYFTPALRRLVDLALEGKDYVRGLKDVEAAVATAGPSLSETDRDEVDYLTARARQQKGELDDALTAYGAVSGKSRFSTAAAYLSGVVEAKRGRLRPAEGHFCRAAGGRDRSTAAYFVDQRYFPVRDLAQLGLGRVAHEELRHGHAFYHYFQVPQDSTHLHEALFESAWTMAELGEHAVARGLLRELRERFPDAAQSVEARVLDALLELYDCDFRKAEADFARFIDDVAPVLDHIDEIRGDPARVRALHRELERLRAGGREHVGDLGAHRLLLQLLDEDPIYVASARRARALRREAELAAAIDGVLLGLEAGLGDQATAVEQASTSAALDALTGAERLEEGLQGLERQLREAAAAGADAAAIEPIEQTAAELGRRIAALRSAARSQLLAEPTLGSVDPRDLRRVIQRDRGELRRLRATSLSLSIELDDRAAELAAVRLGAVKARIQDLLGEARMGRIDAVLGAKKKLEIEVRDMAAGRFPRELFGKLQLEGMVGDDEEFWPYEGEYWADEYEGYR